MITKEDTMFGVHATHCCSIHGCKYCEDDICPVVNALSEGVRCEDCDWDDDQLKDAIQLLIIRGWIPEGFDPNIHDLINVTKSKVE